ncbi:MAG: hypothetical protein IJ736_07605 [Firmicutes bacterium]|nr:hypothetical protein [Bacillota bacterium]
MYYNIKNFDSNVSELFKGQNIESIREKFLTEHQPTEKSSSIKHSENIISANVSYDKELMYELYSEINKRLLPYVLEVIEEYKYDGSPIYREDGIDRETLAQMIDKVIERSQNNVNGVEEIMLENINAASYSDKWEKIDLLKSLIATMLLADIYIR